MTSRLGAVVVSLMLVVTACGGSDMTATSSTVSPKVTFDPCSSIRPDDVVSAFGGSAQPDTSTAPVVNQCGWAVTGSTLGSDGLVVIQAFPSMTRSQFDLTNTTKAPPLDGVGDAAFYVEATHAASMLVGTTVVVVGADFATAMPDALRDRIVDLCRLVAERAR